MGVVCERLLLVEDEVRNPTLGPPRGVVPRRKPDLRTGTPDSRRHDQVIDELLLILHGR